MKASLITDRPMWGINKRGEDTLSPQFRKGKGTPARMEANPLNQDPEKMMAVQSTIDSLRKNQMFQDRFREEATKELGVGASEADLQAAIEKKTFAAAERMYEAGRQEEGRTAGGAGIFRG